MQIENLADTPDKLWEGPLPVPRAPSPKKRQPSHQVEMAELDDQVEIIPEEPHHQVEMMEEELV